MKTILREGLDALGLPYTEGALEQLEAYYRLLDDKNKVMNLTAIEGEEATARLHFLDCAALLRYLPAGAKSLADIGSGAGFPGLVLKILRPELQLTMLDSLQKRVAFQQEVCDVLGLHGVTCLAGRAEEEKSLRGKFDIVTSRAVARLNILSELCLPLCRKGGVFAAMKGPEPEEELEEAARCIGLCGGRDTRVEKYEVPGAGALHSLVIVQKAASTPAIYPRRYAAIKKQPL